MAFDTYYQQKEVATLYEKKRNKGLKGAIIRALERETVDKLTPQKNGRLLEVGVGTGFITSILQKKGVVEGCDISEAMLGEAKQKFPHMKLFKRSILDLKMKNQYTAIITVRVISHFKPREAREALIQCKEALKNRGFLIFNIENPSLFRRVARKITNWGATETYQYSRKEITDLVRASGLQIKRIAYIDHSFLLPLHLYNKLLRGKGNEMIIKLEHTLQKFYFCSATTFIQCTK